MINKKILCKCCSSEICQIDNGKVVFRSIKSISQIEIDYKEKTTDIKCHSCHNWNTLDSDNNIDRNHKKKAQEHLYAYGNK